MFENSPQPLTSDQISHDDTEESVMTERNYTWTLAALEYIYCGVFNFMRKRSAKTVLESAKELLNLIES